MLRRLDKMAGFAIHTRDGRMGHVDDFFFDDQSWHVRYLVAKTGPWLFGRRVLLSPVILDAPDWNREVLPVNLTNAQIESSPDVNLDLPVSRQHERALSQHYDWPLYWHRAPLTSPAIPHPAAPEPLGVVRAEADVTSGSQPAEAATPDEPLDEEENHLRSVDEVTGYTVHAADGDIGRIADFFADETDWKIRYVLIDTGDWLPGRRVLISPDWIDEVNWLDRTVTVHVTTEQVQNSPEYDPKGTLHREHESRLYEYYGFPFYWLGG